MAITPASYNIRPQRNSDFVLPLQFKDSGGTAINLTGYTVLAQVWNKARSTKYGDFVVSVTSATSGQVSIKLPYTVTTSLPDECYYDVMLINPAGLREYYLEGVVRPSQGYTAPS